MNFTKKNSIQVWKTIPVKWGPFSRQHISNLFSKLSVTFVNVLLLIFLISSWMFLFKVGYG